MGNVAGGQNGHFFRIVPPYIDRKKQPGFSTLPAPTLTEWIATFVQMKHVWASPNLVWSVIALAIYFVCPYDLSATSAAHAGPITWAFFAQRLPLWLLVVFGYNAFWHVTLYQLEWAERPFIQKRRYNWNKVMHNLWWSFCGVVIWVGFENVFAFLWATGRLSYLPDSVAFSTPGGFLRFIAGLVLVPAWRDIHFYFSHRLLHFKPIFTQVHSLHHRNTDIEPFAGLCMHPIEHLYYYACILPSLLLFASPFHFLWNGAHLLLAPGASHSGWEDHFQADGFHYMHHRYFECNYAGFSAGFLDVVFNTFMPNFKEENGKAKPRDDAKSVLGRPTTEFLLYLLTSSACVAAPYIYMARGLGLPPLPLALLLSFLSGFGPVLIACLITISRSGFASQLDPFRKKPLSESFLHILIGVIFSSLPVSMTAYLALSPPGLL